jgi:hypothetical protein
MSLYLEDPKESTKRLLELISKFSRIQNQHTYTHTHTVGVFSFYTLKRNQENNSIHNRLKKNKIPRRYRISIMKTIKQ